VADAIDGLHHILQGCESGHTTKKVCAALPGFLVMAADVRPRDGNASNDDVVETGESPKSDAGEEVNQVIDMAECLNWIGNTIDAHLNSQVPQRAPEKH
jgi:hypothetical protein